MYILHNSEDEASRAFIAALPEGHTVIDWYADAQARAEYEAAHPVWPPSAFPSVLISVPAYSFAKAVLDDAGRITGFTRENAPAAFQLLRMPADWSVVEAYQAIVDKRAEDNPPV